MWGASSCHTSPACASDQDGEAWAHSQPLPGPSRTRDPDFAFESLIAALRGLHRHRLLLGLWEVTPSSSRGCHTWCCPWPWPWALVSPFLSFQCVQKRGCFRCYFAAAPGARSTGIFCGDHVAHGCGLVGHGVPVPATQLSCPRRCRQTDRWTGFQPTGLQKQGPLRAAPRLRRKRRK